jgi:hypothetical protein
VGFGVLGEKCILALFRLWIIFLLCSIFIIERNGVLGSTFQGQD